MDTFQVASGSVIGRDHRLAMRNNQDSMYIWQDDDRLIGVVTDGCGSAPHSEVGAQLGAQLFCQALADCSWGRHEWIECFGNTREVEMQYALVAFAENLRTTAPKMGLTFDDVVNDYLLFTIVGFKLEDDLATFFAVGDGMIIINGEPMAIGPFPDNAPPYVGHVIRRIGEYGQGGNVLQYQYTKQITIPLKELETFLVATDGVHDLVKSSDRTLPGLDRLVGGIEQFWENDRYFSGNQELVSRQLRLMGRDWPQANPSPGLLSDDTTLIVGRRRP